MRGPLFENGRKQTKVQTKVKLPNGSETVLRHRVPPVANVQFLIVPVEDASGWSLVSDLDDVVGPYTMSVKGSKDLVPDTKVQVGPFKLECVDGRLENGVHSSVDKVPVGAVQRWVCRWDGVPGKDISSGRSEVRKLLAQDISDDVVRNKDPLRYLTFRPLKDLLLDVSDQMRREVRTRSVWDAAVKPDMSHAFNLKARRHF